MWGSHTIVTLSVANDNLFAKCYQSLPSDQVEGGHHETHASQQHHGDASHRSTSEDPKRILARLDQDCHSGRSPLCDVQNNGNTRKN